MSEEADRECARHRRAEIMCCDNCGASMCGACADEGDPGGDRNGSGGLVAYPTLCPDCYSEVHGGMKT